MLGRRFWIETVSALALAIVLAIVGFACGMPLVAAVAEVAGLDRLAFASSSDLASIPFGIGVACALPPLVAWSVALFERVIAKEEATLSRLAIYLVVPVLAAGMGVARTAFALRAALGSLDDLMLRPTITVGSFELAETIARWSLGAGVGLGLWTWLRARRAQKRTSPPS